MRYFWRKMHPVEQVAPPVFPGASAPSPSAALAPDSVVAALVPSTPASFAAPAVEPVYCTGVVVLRGECVVQWSDGSRQSGTDFELSGESIRITRTAVWVGSKRYPIMELRRAEPVASVGGSSLASPVPSAGAASLGAPLASPAGVGQDKKGRGDDPTWQWSEDRSAWVMRGRDMTPGG